MSGHSHWATIKRKKEAEDQRRGKIFSKLSRGITVAARKELPSGKGGRGVVVRELMSNPPPMLRLAIEKARQANMPKENIKRAIERGIGVGGEGQLLEVICEGYGAGGIAFLVKCLTDNKNRTLSEIRKIFDLHGGSLGKAGSTAYIFSKNPENPAFLVPITDEGAAKKILSLANTLDEHDDVQEVYSNFDIPDELLNRL